MLIEISAPDERAAQFDAVAEANHRIANHLAILASLIRLQSDRMQRETAPLDPADAALSLAGIGAKLEAVAGLHKLLARPREGQAVELGAYLHNIVTVAVESLSAADTTNLDLTIDADCAIDTKRALSIALIACEVITNSIKYAHPSGVSGRVAVACHRAGPDLVLQIEDDGVGLPSGVDPATNGHVGFRVIRALAADLDAEMHFRTDDLGVTFTLRVPAIEARTQAANVQTLAPSAAMGG
jgi:two-component sensor histidine kinase